MNRAQAAKKLIHLADKAVDFAVLLAFLLLLALGIYMLWDSHLVYQAADASNFEIYRPTEENQLSFAELQDINPDVFAWLTIYGTKIDYPVVRGADNVCYLNRNAKDEYSLAGALFLDCNNQLGFADFNSIIYGHHMEQDEMFGGLERFQGSEYFAQHRFGSLYCDGQQHGVEFFAFLAVDAYASDLYRLPIVSQAARQQYLSEIQTGAVLYRDIGVSTDDHLLLLSTCTTDSTNGRHILIGRITDTAEPNPFAESTASNAREQSTHSSQRSRVSLAAAVVLILLLLLMLALIAAKKKKRRRVCGAQEEKR